MARAAMQRRVVLACATVVILLIVLYSQSHDTSYNGGSRWDSSDHTASSYHLGRFFQKATESRPSIREESGVDLPSYTGPFSCNTNELPRQARMSNLQQGGYTLLLHGGEDYVSDHIWNGEGWETAKLQQMERYMAVITALDPSRTGYLDLGVNIGAHAVPMAVRRYHVHAFEPTYANHVLLRCSLALSGISDHVYVNAYGLGENPSRACMQSAAGNFGDSRVKDADACDRTKQVSLGTLDHYYAGFLRGRRKIGVMKMDIQGYEVSAMRKATEFFDSKEAPVAVFFEYDVRMLSQNGFDPLELTRFFHERGYRMWWDHRDAAVALDEFPLFGKQSGWPADPDMVAVKEEWIKKFVAAGYKMNGSKLDGTAN